MSAKNKEDPLAVKVVCKRCHKQQVYRGQIACDRCGKSGSLQLIFKNQEVTR